MYVRELSPQFDNLMVGLSGAMEEVAIAAGDKAQTWHVVMRGSVWQYEQPHGWWGAS